VTVTADDGNGGTVTDSFAIVVADVNEEPVGQLRIMTSPETISVPAMEFRVNTVTANEQVEPSVTSMSDGGWIVTWTSYNSATQSKDIFGQRYDNTGTSVGSEFKINTDARLYYDQINSSITELSDGGWFVAWQSDGQDGSGWGIYAQRYNASGV
jgi:hypothetical protein